MGTFPDPSDPWGPRLGGLFNGGHRTSYQALQNFPSYASHHTNLGAHAGRYSSLAASTLTLWPDPEPIEDAGIRAGEIRAWRCWRLLRNGLLRSMFVEDVWAPGEPMQGRPDQRCPSGVHAWKNRSGALRYGLEHPGRTIVVGQVDLWGEIIEHEHGYQAEFAAIVALPIILSGDGGGWRGRRGLRRLRQAQELYGVGERAEDEK